MDTLTRDTAKSYLWNQIAVILDGLTLAAASVCVGRLAGREALGLYGWVLSTAGLVVLLAALGFKEGIAVLVQRAEDDASLRGLFSRLFSIRAAAAAVAALGTVGILFRSAGLATACAAGAYVGIILISGLLSAFNVAMFQTRAVAIGKIASFFASMMFVVLGARAGSMPAIFGGLALGWVAGGVVFFIPLRHVIFGPRRPCCVRTALELPVALGLVNVFNYLIGSQGAPLILQKASISASEIAVFTVGLNVAMISNRALMGGFANVILAAFSRAAGEPGRLLRIHSLYVRATTILAMPVLLASAVFAPVVARVWLKGDVSEAVVIIEILVALSIVSRLIGGGAHSAALYSGGYHRTGLIVRAVFAFVSVAATFVAARRFGIVGGAVSSGVVGVLVVAAEWAIVRRRQGIGMPWPAQARFAVYSVLGALPAWALTLAQRVEVTVLAMAVFAAGSWLALLLSRPLESGEAVDIAGRGFVGRILSRFEARPAEGSAAGAEV